MAFNAAALWTDKAPLYDGFRDAVHGSSLQERNLDVISNNLANASTPGFKADRLLFNDFMTQEVKTSFDQGALNTTDNPLDFAIQGDGFFQVRTRDGIRLTRNGSFRLLGDGTVVDAGGNTVLGEGNAPITLNPQGPAPQVDSDGQVFQGGELVGKLSVVSVADKKTLEKQGSNFFLGANGQQAATQPAQDYTIGQGALEMSNVTVVKEMVDMIACFRAYESYQKAIRAINELDTKAATQLGRVG